MKRRSIKMFEALAMMSESIHTDGKAMWWEAMSAVAPNEEIGSVCVVHVRGSLDHHREGDSDLTECGDSYEWIRQRTQAAFDSDADTVVLRIDSPGGVCSGLNETVFAIRRMAADAGKVLIAYVDELAASAAYALACACDHIVIPASGIAGSIGVISGLCDQTALDAKMGVRFVTITSGARKADGHPHTPIEDAAINAEQRRVDRLATQFWKLVAQARPINTKEIESYQAGIFLGSEAVNKGLADAVMGWDALLADLNDSTSVNKKPLAKLSQDGSLPIGTNGTAGTTATATARTVLETHPMKMLATLLALVNRTKSSISSEKDPKEKATLRAYLASYEAALAAFKKEKHTKEVHESEEGEDPEAEAEDEGCDTAAEDESAEAGADDSDDSDDDDDKDTDADEKKASAELATLAQTITGKRGAAAVGALSAMLASGQRAAAQVDQIAKERRAEKKTAAIDSALNARRITRHEASTLKSKPLSFVTSFLEMRPKAIINVDDDSIRIPNPNAKSGDGSNLSPEVLAQINTAISCAADGTDKAALRASMVAAHESRMASASNGAGRY